MNLINKKDKIFVAGSGGMVGSAIIRYLNKKGYKKILANNKSILNLLDYKPLKNGFARET